MKNHSLLTKLLCLMGIYAFTAGIVMAGSVTTTFDFSDTRALNSMGLATPTSSNPTPLNNAITIDGVTLTPSTGTVPTITYYRSAYDLYLFKNTSVTLSVPEGSTISKVTFTALASSINGSANTGKLSGLNWTGSTRSVKFSATGTNTIYTISVTYESGEVVAPVLSDEFTFWPEMNNQPSATVKIIPQNGNTVYYTTDGSTPSQSNGTATATTKTLTISKTTTVKAIASNGSRSSEIVSRTYTLGQTVTGVGQFRNMQDGSIVRLYIPDDYNCRVTYVNDDGAEAYVRDNTGAMCISNVCANPMLKVNQHIAGWIVGKLVYKYGMPQFIAIDNNNTNTWFLVIADPVTETDVRPLEIAADSYNEHTADWVTVNDMRVNGTSTLYHNGNEYPIYNLYDLDESSRYLPPYDGALIDITGLAVPNASGNNIVPIYENGYSPIRYVINEDSTFIAPPADINDTDIRLARNLNANEWQTLALPFSITNFDGTILSPNQITKGGGNPVNGIEMEYAAQRSSVAGRPYIVKPNQDISNQIFTGVTLKSGAAQSTWLSFNNINYGMTGTYAPYQLNDNKYYALAYRNGAPVLVGHTGQTLPGTHALITTKTILNLNGTIVTCMGDANLDGITDIADVNHIINQILQGVKTDYADVNKDGAVDIADVNDVINIILGNGPTVDIVLHSPIHK